MTLVIPEDKCTELVARPRLDGVTLSVRLPERRQAFVDVVRALHYHWESAPYAWQRTIGELAGDPVDRLVELGHRIFAAGFPVEMGDELGQRAVAGEYETECRRWVVSGHGDYDGWLRIWWGRGEPDFYRRARFLTGSSYDRESHCVVVRIEAFAEVLDFAEMHGFRVHPKAQALIDVQRQLVASAQVVDVRARSEDVHPTWRRPSLSVGSVGVPARYVDFAPVPAFETTTALLPHQAPAVAAIQGLLISGLFMDMGTGKTRCAIELAHQRQGRISRIVWFCPVGIKSTAVHEILKHTDCSSEQIYVFDDETTGRDLPQATWYIIGLESISGSDRVTLAANALIDDHAMVVVDESSYIKGHASKRTRRITRMASRARYRLILTGTPLTQGVEGDA